MTTLAIDTFKIVKRLKDVGFTESQAEAVTDVLREAREADLQDLVTKGDLKSEVALLRSDLKAEMSETKAEMMKWMIGALGLQTLVILGGLAALIKLVAR
ncbi:MAG: DUF1640 domain-containing protein [Alphaproteobacteria bacterium]